MDQLETLPTLSIAELRKILQDNEVMEVGESKEELVEQVSQILLTNMVIQEMMEEGPDQPTPTMTPTMTPTPTIAEETRTREREQQDREYEQAVAQDITITPQPYAFDENGDYIIDQPDQIPINEELTIDELRSLRLTYYSGIA